jgi:hypothetical protein
MQPSPWLDRSRRLRERGGEMVSIARFGGPCVEQAVADGLDLVGREVVNDERHVRCPEPGPPRRVRQQTGPAATSGEARRALFAPVESDAAPRPLQAPLHLR